VERHSLHAVLLSGPAGARRLAGPLAEALDGTGPAILPLDAGLPAPLLRRLLDAFRPDVVVGADGDATFRSDGRGAAADTAVIVGTSGSTGEPKGVELSAAALLNSARASLARVGARPGERWLCCLPVTHVAGLQVLVRSHVAGTEPAVTTYGMSETCGGCVYDGVPLDGVRVRAGDDGLLRISGPVLMNRYYGGADINEEFVTSDLGYVSNGRVTVRGRADDVINTGGHKVVPGEVAAALESCPAVREVVVVGRPDQEWGERVIAVVVPADPADPPSLELLRMHVRERLPRYASPSEVVLAEAIPVLPSGKPDLASLRKARTLREREHSPARSVN